MKNIKIGYRDYKIKNLDSIVSKCNEINGQFLASDGMIALSSTEDNISHANTLIHEILHAIVYQWGIELDDKEEENGSITKGLKSQFVAQIKDTANKLLAQSDWYVIRKLERNIDIPTDIQDKRNAIIAESNRLETDINAVTDVEALIKVLNTQNFQ